MQVAVDVCIKRFYHYYLEVPDGATNEQIEQIAKQQLTGIDRTELELYRDADLEVETDDIEWVQVDEESIPALN